MFEGPEKRGTSDMTGRAHVVEVRGHSIGLVPNMLVATRGTASVRCAKCDIGAAPRNLIAYRLPNADMPFDLI